VSITNLLGDGPAVRRGRAPEKVPARPRRRKEVSFSFLRFTVLFSFLPPSDAARVSVPAASLQASYVAIRHYSQHWSILPLLVGLHSSPLSSISIRLLFTVTRTLLATPTSREVSISLGRRAIQLATIRPKEEAAASAFTRTIETMTDDRRLVRFDELALNDPNLGHRSGIDLDNLQNDLNEGGRIDNLIDVWQSNVTVDDLVVTLV